MVKKIDKNAQRLKRHKRVRANISGTAERPRLDVFRSANHIYAQVIDDANGVTLVSASSTEKDFGSYGGNKEAARKLGQGDQRRGVRPRRLPLPRPRQRTRRGRPRGRTPVLMGGRIWLV